MQAILKFILINVLLLPGITAIGQQKISSDYTKEFTSVYTNERSVIKSIIKANRYCHIKYTYVANVYDQYNNDEKEVTENGEVFASKSSRQVRSNDYLIFADSTDIFSVNKKKKTILHARALRGTLDVDNVLFNRNILDDSTARYYDVTKSVTDNNIIIYSLIGKNKEICQFTTARFFYNPKINMFTKVVVEFNKASANHLLGYTLIVNERESLTDSQYDIIARNNVLSKDGNLRSEFKGYKYNKMIKD